MSASSNFIDSIAPYSATSLYAHRYDAVIGDDYFVFFLDNKLDCKYHSVRMINYTSGCICDSLTIDGKESADLSPKVIKDAIVKALEKIDDMATLQDILTTVAETGEYEDLGHCEQCGDWITSYTLEI